MSFESCIQSPQAVRQRAILEPLEKKKDVERVKLIMEKITRQMSKPVEEQNRFCGLGCVTISSYMLPSYRNRDKVLQSLKDSGYQVDTSPRRWLIMWSLK